MINQRTLKKSVQITGIGVHSGEKVSMTLHPAPIHSGIVFRQNNHVIPAQIAYVASTSLCTCLIKDNHTVATVEHLMSALFALQIDNCLVELIHPELPIMDGSAAPFVDLILSAGIVTQEALKSFIRIKKTITVRDGDKWASLSPYHGFRVINEIVFTHPVIANTAQKIMLDYTPDNYIQMISRARTFGFYADYEMMLEKKLARGASLENTVVIEADRVMNAEGLRYPDEFVKHKLLDAIGDLYLSGHNIIGEFAGFKSGHTLNGALVTALLADATAFELVTFENNSDAPVCYQWSV